MKSEAPPGATRLNNQIGCHSIILKEHSLGELTKGCMNIAVHRMAGYGMILTGWHPDAAESCPSTGGQWLDRTRNEDHLGSPQTTP